MLHQEDQRDNYEQGENACRHTSNKFDYLVGVGDDTDAPKRALDKPISRAV